MPRLVTPRRSAAATAAVGALALLTACSSGGVRTTAAGTPSAGTSASATTGPSPTAAPSTAPPSPSPTPAPSQTSSVAVPSGAPSAVASPADAAPTAGLFSAPSGRAQPTCGAPAGESWVSVYAAPIQDGEGVYVLSRKTLASCDAGLDPTVTVTGTNNTSYYLPASAQVILLTTAHTEAPASVSDFQKLVTAHAAGKNSSGSYLWPTNGIFTLRVDGNQHITFVGDGPRSS
ncbi:hypothetical protein ABIA33_006286 [Streptacidiphilus sp. MAP12-16]|uniref:hypothetical protein n=1 Tax=Streptacidiphilus sp. MAP12-16 TaxID=3156300 RepID=UPI0035135AC2